MIYTATNTTNNDSFISQTVGDLKDIAIDYYMDMLPVNHESGLYMYDFEIEDDNGEKVGEFSIEIDLP